MISSFEQYDDSLSIPDDPNDFPSEEEICSYCINSVISSEAIMNRIQYIFSDIYHRLMNFLNSSSKDLVLYLNKSTSPEDSQIDPLLGVRIQTQPENPSGVSFIKQTHHFAVLLRTMELIYHTLRNGELISKRSLFYQDMPLYRNYNCACSALEEVSSLLEVPRSSLGVISCPKGFVCGPLRFYDKANHETDCRHGSVSIPPRSDSISIVKSSAIAVLVIEKDTVFVRLSQTTLVNEIILVTGRGVPDYSTREFVKLLEDTLSIPIIGLFDGDAYGIFIMTIYRFGSRAAAYDGMGLTASRLKWAGIRPSEISRYLSEKEIIEKARDVTEKEILMLERIEKEKFIPIEIKKEIAIIKAQRKAIEIEALIGFGDDNPLVDSYLPEKFAARDWI